MKHIELDIHFVRDQVTQRHLQVQFISSTDQIADSFTKALPIARFCSLRNNLNVHELPLRLRGRNGATESHAPDKAHAQDKAQDNDTNKWIKIQFKTTEKKKKLTFRK